MNRRMGTFIVLLAVLFLITAGTWYYRGKCWGMDQCAAAEAESHEREKPKETQ